MPMRRLTMRATPGSNWGSILAQWWWLNGDGGPVLRMDNVDLRRLSSADFTETTCIIGDQPGVSVTPTINPVVHNLIQNPDFNNGFANWWGIGLNPVYVQNGAIHFDIPAGQAYGTLWQEVPVPVTAGTPIELSFNLGNTGSIPQTVRVFLRDLDWGTARSCSFTVPANAVIRAYSMRAAPGTNWGRILAQWWLDNGDGSPAIVLDDVSLFMRPGTSTALECSAPLALEFDPMSVSPTGNETTASATMTASPTIYMFPTATPTSGFIPTASLTPTGPTVPTLIPTATATPPPPTDTPTQIASPTVIPTNVPTDVPLPPTDVPTDVPSPVEPPTAVPSA
jgi:hypothetical protein